MSANTSIQNIMAGALVGVINITVAISVAALMFAGTPPEFFATGVAILLLGTVVGGLGGTLAGGFHGVIVAPRSGLAPVYAGLVASIIAIVPTPEQAFPTIVMAVMISCITTGVILFTLGYFRLGGLVRYIPYPVMGGFFAGIGLIFVRGGIGVASGEAVSIDNAAVFLDLQTIYLTIPAITFAVALYVMQRISSHWAVFPGILVLALVIFYIALGVSGTGQAAATEAGWLPEIAAISIALPIFDFNQFAMVDWGSVAAQAGSIATVGLLCAIILLLDVSGIEIIANCELRPNRELKVAGITNVVNGVVGGYPGVHVASDTAFTYKLGGRTRLMGFVYAATVGIAMAAGTGFIGSAPTFILGGLLIYVGLDFLVDWVWNTAKDMPIFDYLMILAILVVIAFAGILEGVAFGFLIAIVLFVINYSRLSVIKNETSGETHASHVDRGPVEREILNREGGQIHIIRLQGFIFFGTADGLFSTIRSRIENAKTEHGIHYLVLDFRHVSELDTSAVRAFAKLAKYCDTVKVSIAVSSLTQKSSDRLKTINFFTEENAQPARLLVDHLDDGVAWAEDRILENMGDRSNSDEAHDLVLRLGSLLGDTEAASEIAEYFESITINSGEYLFRQGDPGDALYILASGVAAVVINSEGHQDRVIRIFEEGTLLGEMALYTQEPRSASVRIEEDALLFRLPQEKFLTMQGQHPYASGLFHSYVVRLLSERLGRANRELATYQ